MDARRSPLTGLGLLGAGALLVVAAVVVALLAVWRYQAEQEPRDWPTVEGTMLANSIERLETPAIRYYPRIKYSYEVAGQAYGGEQVAVFPLSFSGSEEAVIWTDKYNAGEHHPVYYDPADPSRSLLRIGISTRTRWLLVLPLLLAGAGALLLWSWTVYRRPPKPGELDEFDI